ncbi:MerR family transcriptional regulator [Paenibacillus thermotolerans]|uniref:MerR family transcriptional regulator n=1 Tax=Paenibacillus thermotolerans TaxID=3027807 RepID=UPI0023684B37|nr:MULTISPECIES: MerR family transcriptional regulator [unclassified Paenibacillus]
MTTLLTVGQIARLFGVTAKTLRHYDTIGLFSPSQTGPENQYRYYAPEQIKDLSRIIFLRELGVGLEVIRELKEAGALKDPNRLTAILREHTEELRASILERQKLLHRVEHELKLLLGPELPKNDWGGTKMEPRIEHKEAFIVAGMAVRGAGGSPKFAEIWERFVPEMGSVPNRINPHETYGLCCDFDGSTVNYLAGVQVGSTEGLPAGMTFVEVPAQTYAVFTHTGKPSGLFHTFRRIYEEWLPANNFQPLESYEFEFYGERFFGPDNEKSETDIYVPIKS